MSLAKQVAHNTLIQLVGRVISVGLGVVILGLMTRSLGTLGYGHLTTIMAFLQLFAIFADCGLSLTTLQLIAEPGANRRQIINNLVSFRTVTAAGFLALAPLISLAFPYPAAVKWGIALMTLSYFAAMLQQVFISIWQKELQTVKAVTADVVGRLLSLAVMLYSFYHQGGLTGAMLAIIIGNVVNLGCLIFSLRSLESLSWEIDWPTWKKIFTCSWPLATTIVFNLVYFKADTIIMSLFRPASEVGLYGAPYKILEVLIQLPSLFLGLMLPLFAAAWAQHESEKLRAMFQKAFDFLLQLAIPLIVGTWWLAKPVMQLIAGQAFLASAPILRILIVAVGIIFLSMLFGYAVIAVNQQKKMITFYASNAILGLLGYFLLIPKFTYWAAAGVTVLTELVIAVAAAYVFYQKTKIAISWRCLKTILPAVLIMSLALWLTAGLAWWVTVPLGIAVYFAALYLLGGLDRQLLQEVLPKLT